MITAFKKEFSYILCSVCLFLISFSAVSQGKYVASADLVNIVEDKVKVRIETPKVFEHQIDWVFAKVIPGSYSVKDFGRFIENFTAFDAQGNSLPVIKQGNNVFIISAADKLHSVEYWVNDTWDADNDNYIFQPGGTNIEKDKNVVINHQGFFGYLEGYKMLPYEITINKPEHFYGSTALKRISSTSAQDVFYSTDFVRLTDNPILYSMPDTLSFMSGNTRVHISVYSQTGAVNALEMKTILTPLSSALSGFFVNMPVDNYHFLMFFPVYDRQGVTKYGGFGALEHSYSSLYFLPESVPKNSLHSMVLSVAAHEFLHILTPLNVHSKEIAEFDFRNPKMSRHLWMYEGVTEYFADLVQVKYNLISQNQFKDAVEEKLNSASKYPDVSFTEMSRNILSDEYKKMYLNVYSKGALIGFLLDIYLHELSGGKRGLRELMLKLASLYGPDKPFDDEEIIDVIVENTYPEIRTFFDHFVIGSKPLPYADFFAKIGWEYVPVKEITTYSFGNISGEMIPEEKQWKVAKDIMGNNVLGLQKGDVLIQVNNQKVNEHNYKEIFENNFLPGNQPKSIKIIYLRDEDYHEITAESVPFTENRPAEIKELKKLNKQQRLLKNRILGK
jgi:predicted metalloprotease with PDZ domain